MNMKKPSDAAREEVERSFLKKPFSMELHYLLTAADMLYMQLDRIAKALEGKK